MSATINQTKQVAALGLRTPIKVLAVLSLLIAGLSIMPFGPAMSSVEVWTYALNEAVANHLVFGRDVIFTFGPFASVYTQLYHPATYPIALIGSAIIAIGYCAGFALLSFNNRPLLLLLLPLLGAESWVRDATLMTPPLLLMLITFRISLPPGSIARIKMTSSAALLVSAVSMSIGILPLIKASFSGLVAVELALSVVMLVCGQHLRMAVAVVLITLLSMASGWVWTGQPLDALPQFFLAQAPIISGYSEAMSIEGHVSQVYHWLIAASLCVLVFYFYVARSRGLLGAIAIAGFVFYLFVCFKSGFVRQDMHPRIAAAAFITVGLSLAPMLTVRQGIVAALVALSGWGVIEHSMPDFRRDLVLQRTHDVYRPLFDTLARRITGLDSFPQMFAATKQEIHDRAPLPNITGTADVYPMRMDILFANDIKWAPRPIIQSYSAYTPKLDRMNAEHLVGVNAPQNIMFTVIAIDHRLPSIEDALSWRELLSRYSIVDRFSIANPDQSYLRMVRRSVPIASELMPLSDTEALINIPVAVPPSDGIVIAKIDMQPTLLGQIALGLYKLPEVFIELTLTDDRIFRFRYIPSMGKTGFVLSPLVRSNNDFLAMASGNANTLRVKQMTLTTSANVLWRRNIRVVLETLRIDPQSIATNLFLPPTK
ncbi:hypothetical protein PQQ86_03315 [Paraburkholderia sediminicola]|uniref:hypothetical protein n=1 Tax=Paraburkholderia sediminicola TaxID=458836 RepID=UPI0038B7339C